MRVRLAEHSLAESHATLVQLLSEPLRTLSGARAGEQLCRAVFANLQLQRSLENVLGRAERLVDQRVALSADEVTETHTTSNTGCATLRAMHDLLRHGLDTVAHSLESGAALELEAMRTREIHMNGFEAQARNMLLVSETDQRHSVNIFELVDAYESAGNQLYRLSETLGGDYGLAHPEPTLKSAAG